MGAKLQKQWQKWLQLQAFPKVVQILKEGYFLTFRTKPSLSREPLIVSQVRTFMSLLGLLTATEKPVRLGRLRIISKQWQLKNKSLYKVIANISASTPCSGCKKKAFCQANHCTHWATLLRSLETPQKKAGVLTYNTTLQARIKTAHLLTRVKSSSPCLV